MYISLQLNTDSAQVDDRGSTYDCYGRGFFTVRQWVAQEGSKLDITFLIEINIINLLRDNFLPAQIGKKRQYNYLTDKQYVNSNLTAIPLLAARDQFKTDYHNIYTNQRWSGHIDLGILYAIDNDSFIKKLAECLGFSIYSNESVSVNLDEHTKHRTKYRKITLATNNNFNIDEILSRLAKFVYNIDTVYVGTKKDKIAKYPKNKIIEEYREYLDLKDLDNVEGRQKKKKGLPARKLHSVVIEKIKEKTPLAKKLIDLGCGDAKLTKQLVEDIDKQKLSTTIKDIILVDAKPNNIANKSDKYNIQSIVGSISHALNHISDIDIALLLNVLKRNTEHQVHLISKNLFTKNISLIIVSVYNKQFAFKYKEFNVKRITDYSWEKHEFYDWCEEIARNYGYKYDVDGIRAPEKHFPAKDNSHHMAVFFRSDTRDKLAELTSLGQLLKTKMDEKVAGYENIQPQTNNLGSTPEQYEIELRRRESRVRAELAKAHPIVERHVLESEFIEIKLQLRDTGDSCEAHTISPKERIVQLEQLRGEFPNALLDPAIEALQQGREEGDGLRKFAKAVFQLGMIAEGAVRYDDALENYEDANRLQPNNARYLNAIGLLHYKLANCQKKVDSSEQVLITLENVRSKHNGGQIQNKLPSENSIKAEVSAVCDRVSLTVFDRLISSLRVPLKILALMGATYIEYHLFVNYPWDKPELAFIASTGMFLTAVSLIYLVVRKNIVNIKKLPNFWFIALIIPLPILMFGLMTGDPGLESEAPANHPEINGKDHPNVEKAQGNLDNALYSQVNEQYSKSEYQKAADYFKQGNEQHSMGEYQKALKSFEQARDIFLKINGKDHPNVENARGGLGNALTFLGNEQHSMGEYQKALKSFEQALNIHRNIHDKQVLNIRLKVREEDHPNVARNRNSLGSVLYSLGEYQKALKYFKQARDIFLKINGKDHSHVKIAKGNVGKVLHSLGNEQYLMGEYYKAIGYYEQAQDIYLSIYEEDHPRVVTIQRSLDDARLGLPLGYGR